MFKKIWGISGPKLPIQLEFLPFVFLLNLIFLKNGIICEKYAQIRDDMRAHIPAVYEFQKRPVSEFYAIKTVRPHKKESGIYPTY